MKLTEQLLKSLYRQLTERLESHSSSKASYTLLSGAVRSVRIHDTRQVGRRFSLSYSSLTTARCEPSAVDFLREHKGCLLFSCYEV